MMCLSYFTYKLLMLGILLLLLGFVVNVFSDHTNFWVMFGCLIGMVVLGVYIRTKYYNGIYNRIMEDKKDLVINIGDNTLHEGDTLVIKDRDGDMVYYLIKK